MRRLWIALPGLLFLLGGCSAYRFPSPDDTRLLSHEGCRLNVQQFELALTTAAYRTGWHPLKKENGSFEALYNEDGETIRMSLTHGEGRTAMRYLESRGLDFDGRQIDAAYARDVEALQSALRYDILYRCARSAASTPPKESILETPAPPPDRDVAPDPVMIESVPPSLSRIR